MAQHTPSTEPPPTAVRPPTDAEIAEAARAESLDKRTVIRALAGLPVKGIAGERAARAVARVRERR